MKGKASEFHFNSNASPQSPSNKVIPHTMAVCGFVTFLSLTLLVLSVVKLRACWMQGTNKCLVNGNSTYCNCPTDLCNGAGPATAAVPAAGRLVASLCVTLLLFLLGRCWTDGT